MAQRGAESIPTGTFGSFLRFLRRRARLTQRDLAVAVNYSEGQICHLEHDRRTPDLTMLVALFVPALYLEDAPEDTARLLALADAQRRAPSDRPPFAPTLVAAAHMPATPLIGREHQRAAIAELLASPTVRLLTISGPPGVGKTHLALQLTHDLHPRYADGAHFIDLSAVGQFALVTSAVAHALEVNEDAHADAVAALQAALRHRQILLVLDNFEHVAGAAPLLAELLAAAPGLTLLLTSRVALRLRAEHLFVLPPLEVPDLACLPPLETLAQIESVALLLARLRAATPVTLTAANALPLAAICVRVDGLPLAIELVAARGHVLTPHELLKDVAHQHMRWRGRDVPLRHQTLTAALAWSYEQLSPGAQRLFARLSVFVDGWVLEAVLPVCGFPQADQATLHEQLEELLDHSLIQRHTLGETSRFTMLAMVRESASARKQAHPDAPTLHRQLLVYLAELAEHAAQQLVYSAEQQVWLARLDAEHDNMRSALQWALAAVDVDGLRLAGALWRFWYMRGFLREGRRWLEAFLALPWDGHPSARAYALDGAGILAWRQGEFAQATQWCHTALDLYRSECNPRGEAQVLSHLGSIVGEQGVLSQAMTYYEASLPLYRALGDTAGTAAVLHNLGNIYCQQNNNERALAFYDECLDVYAAIGDSSGIALVELGVGVIARDGGNWERAHRSFSRSFALAQQLGDEWNGAIALLNLGDVTADCGDTNEARRLLGTALATLERLGDQQSVSLAQSRLGIVEFLAGNIAAAIGRFRQCVLLANALGFHPGVAEGLDGLAGCVARSQPLLATRLLAAAAAIRETTPIPLALADQLRHDAILHTARCGVDAASWTLAWSEGRAMGMPQAIAMALAQVSAAA